MDNAHRERPRAAMMPRRRPNAEELPCGERRDGRIIALDGPGRRDDARRPSGGGTRPGLHEQHRRRSWPLFQGTKEMTFIGDVEFVEGRSHSNTTTMVLRRCLGYENQAGEKEIDGFLKRLSIKPDAFFKDIDADWLARPFIGQHVFKVVQSAGYLGTEDDLWLAVTGSMAPLLSRGVEFNRRSLSSRSSRQWLSLGKTNRGRVEAQTEGANVPRPSLPRKDDLRPDEWRKIQRGAPHFGSKLLKKKGALEGVDHKVVASGSELL